MTPISQRNFSKKQKIALLLLIIAITITVSESFQWIGIDYPFYIMLPQGQTPDKIDFEDFIAFAQAFGAKEGDPNYNPLADTNTDGVVSFPDFIAFAGQFGLERPSTSEKFSHSTRQKIKDLCKLLKRVRFESPKANLTPFNKAQVYVSSKYRTSRSDARTFSLA